jgi:dTMP kinase
LKGKPVAGGANDGLLITFEGPEGSGKTTLIHSLSEHLAAKGYRVCVFREPGGTEIGERIRNILLDMTSIDMCAETELLLLEASRAQLVREKILPALNAGMIILCDRFADASVAYQGAGRGLGVAQVELFSDFALEGIEPDLTFLCLLPPEAGRDRLQGRHQDRLDQEEMAFHQRVYEAYEQMAVSGKARFSVIDATAPPPAMLAQALDLLKRLEHSLLKNLQ